MRAREVFLALLIILGGVFLYYAQTGRLNFEGDGWDGFFGSRGEEFIFENTQEIPSPIPARLDVRNSHGAVEIEASGNGPVTVLFRKHVWRKDKAAAQAVADGLKMIVNREGDRLVLSTNRDDFKKKNFETDFKIIVPAGTPVLVKNAYGPVKARGTGTAELINTHGRISASAVAGGLVLRTSYEDVAVDGVQGDCRIDVPHGQVIVQNVQGDLLVDNTYGSVRAEKAAKKLTISASHSDVTAADIQGDAEIGSSYETIRLTRAAAAKIRGSHCDIVLAGIKGPVDVINDYGSVTADDIQGGFKVEGKDLGVTGRSIAGPEIRLQTSYQDVRLLDFSGPTTVSLGHGDLTLRPRDLSAPIGVQGSYCAVTLEWPAGLRAPFEGQTTSGNIAWELAEKPTLQKTNGTSVTRAFSDPAGKPGVTIVTTYGDIRVKSSAPASPTVKIF
jgi:DUF4097 and DUF4098 domain-containing protein YvlB